MQITLEDGADGARLNFEDLPDTGESGQLLIVENLGPGDVYFDRSEEVDPSSGIKLSPDGWWEFPMENTAASMYFTADGGDADLRYTVVG